MLECVLNVSEGRDADVLDALRRAAGDALLDVHTDPHHHRSVFTLAGEEAPRRLTVDAIQRIDLRRHVGAHPRVGAVDVVPFVPLGDATMADALEARDAFARWIAADLGVPAFRYGPERTLPEVRRRAFRDLAPDDGPDVPHPSAGACCVGARPVLVAYNVWVDGSLDQARSVAAAVRSPHVRALGVQVGVRPQVSLNLIAPHEVGPADAYDEVAEQLRAVGARADGGELVGLVPAAVLASIDPARWTELDLSPDRTIEARLAGEAG